MPPVDYVVDNYSHIPLIYIGHLNLHHSYCKDFRLDILAIQDIQGFQIEVSIEIGSVLKLFK